MLVPSLHGHYPFHRYYGLIRLLACHFHHLRRNAPCTANTVFFQNTQDLTGMPRVTILSSPRSQTPTEPIYSRHYRVNVVACCFGENIGFRSIFLTRLYHFTLSHCGSLSFLPTLKPDLTALAPRLDNGG